MKIDDATVTDAKLNPGYSEGPLVDASGSMHGMNVAYFAGRGIAVSIESVRERVARLKDGDAKQGFLGVVVEPVRLLPEIANSPEVAQEEGALVRSVEPASPARVAGVAMGDVILGLGERR